MKSTERKETAYTGNPRMIQRALNRQLRGQAWFGPTNSITVLSKKEMGTRQQHVKNRLMVNVTRPLKVSL